MKMVTSLTQTQFVPNAIETVFNAQVQTSAQPASSAIPSLPTKLQASAYLAYSLVSPALALLITVLPAQQASQNMVGNA